MRVSKVAERLRLLGFFIAGPIIAFAILGLGCGYAFDAFAFMCDHNNMGTPLLALTVAVWLGIATCVVLVRLLHA
jgi:hypothetical protein